jgi:hypothetical protein
MGFIAVGIAVLVVGVLWFLRLGTQLDEIGASRFGMRVLTLRNGSRIFLKREVRGQNFDVVFISRDSNECRSANPETDLIFKYDANPLTVSQSEDTLIVFWNGAFGQPKQPFANIVVKRGMPRSLSSTSRETDMRSVQSINIPLDTVRRGSGECVEN